MKHYQDHDPLHGHGEAIPKPKRAYNGGPIVELSDYPVASRTEPRRQHRRVGSMATVAMLAALAWGGGYRR